MMMSRPSETRVDSVSLPYQGTLWYPALGVLDVRLSSPVTKFGRSDIAASQGEPRRWFVSSPGPRFALKEVDGSVVLEYVNDRRKSERQPIHAGYGEAEFFPDRRTAEEFAARRAQRDQEVDARGAESDRRRVTMSARARHRSLWRVVDETFEVAITPGVQQPDRWILTPRSWTKALPRASAFDVSFERGWVPGGGGPFPVRATVRALGRTDAQATIELWPQDEGDTCRRRLA